MASGQRLCQQGSMCVGNQVRMLVHICVSFSHRSPWGPQGWTLIHKALLYLPFTFCLWPQGGSPTPAHTGLCSFLVT